jgi:hypothetical protein
MEENQNRILLAVTLFAIVFGGATLWVQHKVKTRQPVIGWHELGTENFDLKPSAYKTFTYQELPAKFRVEVHASDPVAFGFVTPDTYGHFTSTVLQIDFATQPCGSASATNADVNCATVSGQRYLLLADTREDAVPQSPSRKERVQKTNSPSADSALPANHVTVKMYDWRCLRFCENLPRS